MEPRRWHALRPPKMRGTQSTREPRTSFAPRESRSTGFAAGCLSLHVDAESLIAAADAVQRETRAETSALTRRLWQPQTVSVTAKVAATSSRAGSAAGRSGAKRGQS